MLKCEFCNKEYSRAFTLDRHKKTTKACIDIQERRSREETSKVIESLKIRLDESLKINESLKIRLDESLKFNEYLKAQVELLKDSNTALIDKLSKSNITTTTNNNFNSGNVSHNTNNNNFKECFKNLNPFTEQNIRDSILKSLSSTSIIDGEEQYMSDFIRAIKPMIMITDPARNRICLKSDEGKKQRSDSTTVIRSVYKQTKDEHDTLIKNALKESPEYNIENLKRLEVIGNTITEIRTAIHDSSQNKKNKLVDKIATRLNREYTVQEQS